MAMVKRERREERADEERKEGMSGAEEGRGNKRKQRGRESEV